MSKKGKKPAAPDAKIRKKDLQAEIEALRVRVDELGRQVEALAGALDEALRAGHKT